MAGDLGQDIGSTDFVEKRYRDWIIKEMIYKFQRSDPLKRACNALVQHHIGREREEYMVLHAF